MQARTRCAKIKLLKQIIMNNYETVFILTPVLSDVQVKEAVEKFQSVLKDAGAKLSHTENWGLKKMAYPIQKKSTGFYTLFQFEGAGDVVEQLELAFRRDERILRFLTTKMDKHHVAFAERRRSKAKA